MSAEACERPVRLALVLLVVLGIALRLVACALDPPLHPDEYFQYLEPAWWHLTGVGQSSWEWRDGIRSWVLPFYNGGWMALLLRLGMPPGAAIGWFLKAHWAVINALVVPLAFRGGAHISRRLTPIPASPSAGPSSGWQGGLLAAALCATYPVLVTYAGHTISELPSTLCLVASLVLTAELLEQEGSPALRGKAALVGCLLSLGACLRIASGPLALMPALWLLVRGKFRLLAIVIGAALVPALVFGLVDKLTWGSFASSFVEYTKTNFIEGKADEFGVESDDWYLRKLQRRAGFALPLLLVPALLGVRATWPYLLSALGLVAYLSAQPHKEERFVFAFWPFLLIAAAGALGGLLAKWHMGGAPTEPANATRRLRLPRGASMLAAALWVGSILYGGSRRLRGSAEWVDQQDRLRALAWAGKQEGVTGLLADIPFTGGAFWFGAPAPQLPYVPELLSNPIVTHALVQVDSEMERVVSDSSFQVIRRIGGYVVLRRRP